MVGASAYGDRSFAWPKGKRAAVSLTFDDARPSQIDRALPILAAHAVKAAFYVRPATVGARLSEWRRAAAEGHEIGNHTLTHPCSGNFPWSRANALQEYSLAQIEAKIGGANVEIEGLLGLRLDLIGRIGSRPSRSGKGDRLSLHALTNCADGGWTFDRRQSVPFSPGSLSGRSRGDR